MTNRCFNFHKFRVFKKIACQEYDESFQDYLVGVAGKQRQDNPDFLVNTPGIQAYYKGQQSSVH